MNDKMQHFLVCAVIAAVVAVIALLLFGMTMTQSAVAAVAVAMAAGFGKEYGDKNATGNHWCWLDIAADFAGAIAGTAAALLIYFLFKAI